MRRIALSILLFLTLFYSSLYAGFFPSPVTRSIAASDGTHIQLNKPFPVTGMSGIVIHNFGNQLEAITGYIAQTSSSGEGKLVAKEIIHHDELPSIKTPVAKGDKVIGGYLYNTVLLLAPNAEIYANITDKYHKRWIHPDLYAMFLSKEGDGYPTRENLAKFAKEYQVGLIYIIKKKSAVLLDPISGQIVAKRAFKGASKKAQYPFFMRFDSIKTGIFSESVEGNYYQTMERL